MKLCQASNCENPVFGKGYCRNHQNLRADFDPRTIAQKGLDKARMKRKVLSLPHITEDQKAALETRQNLLSDLDFVFSRYIRIRDADENGMVMCYTCPGNADGDNEQLKRHWSLLQCAHYISRKNLGLRYDPRNCRPCCAHCNEYLHGNLEVYRVNLEKEQPGLPAMLEEQATQVERIGTNELKQMLIDLRAKIKIVEAKLKK